MNKQKTLNPQKVKGTVEYRLYDSLKLAKVEEAIINGASKEEISELKDWASKPIFKGNSLWKSLFRLTGKDIKIPFLTGLYVKKIVRNNLVTTRGKQIIAEQLNGVTTTPVTAIALGTGTTSAVAGDTALETEITTSGGSRGSATTSSVTTTTTKDTAQWVKTFSFTGTFAVTEEGLFDNNTTGGNMLARQVFSAINVQNGDSLQVTHKIQATV